MIKNILFLFSSIILGFVLIVSGYLLTSKKTIATSNPFIPATNFSLENAPTDSLIGKISSFSGNVAWQSRTAPIANLINSNIDLRQGEELITQGNGKAYFQFPKILDISMQENSDLSIIQTLPANFVFEQKQGDVTYTKINGTTPVSVRGFDLLIEVNGSVEISMDVKTSKVFVNVSSGTATAAYTDNQNNTQTVTINPKDEFSFDNNSKIYSL